MEGLVWKYPELDETPQHFLIPSGAVTATFSNGLREEYVARAVDRTMGVLVGRASLCDNGQILLIGASPSGRYVTWASYACSTVIHRPPDDETRSSD